MQESLRNLILKNSCHVDQGSIIDLSREEMSMDDYVWLGQVVNQSGLLRDIYLPALTKQDVNDVMTILEAATIKSSSIQNIIFQHFNESLLSDESMVNYQKIQSRLVRNRKKIIGIHGGGNIGLGLMADVVSKSNMDYQIIATSNNLALNNIINSRNRLWLQHGVVSNNVSTCVKNVSMISRERPDVERLYQDACMVAVCTTAVVMNDIAKDIAHALIARYLKDGSGLKILVLMNIPNCDTVAHGAIESGLHEICQDKAIINQILARIEIIPTVIDRIVVPVTYKSILERLSVQLEKFMSPEEVRFTVNDPDKLIHAIKCFNLEPHILNAEHKFSFYVPSYFHEAKNFSSLKTVDDLATIEAIKNKYINGPHAILAWIGGLLGCHTIAEAIRHPFISSFIKEMMENEIRPILLEEYPEVTEEELENHQENFIKRCEESIRDPVTRVGRDPLRKLDSGGRVRGTIELAEKNNLDITMSRLVQGIAAGILYATNNIDPENAGCKKIREIYKGNNSYAAVLCYNGPAPAGSFSGFNPREDRERVNQVLSAIAKLDDKLAISKARPKHAILSRKNAESVNYSIGVISMFRNHNEFLQRQLKSLGIHVCLSTGHLTYTNFKPLNLSFELVFVRHGETYGNCGQSTPDGLIDQGLVDNNVKNSDNRIYQGNVDTEINQLTVLGKQQAIGAAHQLKQLLLDSGWEPDVIYASPLKRAQDTAEPFVNQNSFHSRYQVLDDIKEMAFGGWDNRRVCDLSDDNICHSFYRQQHSLVKDELDKKAENFCEVLLRAHKILMKLNEMHAGKKIVMFSHSMFGAACCILLGLGNKYENEEYLAFDGKRANGTYYTMPNATPFLLNFTMESPGNRYGT